MTLLPSKGPVETVKKSVQTHALDEVFSPQRTYRAQINPMKKVMKRLLIFTVLTILLVHG